MRLAIVVPLTGTDKPWPTRTVSLERVTRHDPTGHDTTAVAAVIHTLVDLTSPS